MTGPYGGVILEHFRRPRNRGVVERADVSSESVNPLCGDRVRVQLAIVNDVVTEARFVADACAICVASASLLTSFLEGAPVARGQELDADTVVRWLESEIPAARRACATLPMDALQRGLRQWYAAGNEPNAGQRAGHVIAGILLAAGSGRRFGGEKLAALLEGEPIVRHSARALRAAVDAAWVVVAPDDRVVRDALVDLDVHVVVNERASLGLGTSIAAGIAALPLEAEASFVALGDQPSLPEGVYRELLREFAESKPDIVAPAYRGVQANPVLFARAVFPELVALEGDAGARAVVRRDARRLKLVAVEASVPLDVDHPDDLIRLRAR